MPSAVEETRPAEADDGWADDLVHTLISERTLVPGDPFTNLPTLCGLRDSGRAFEKYQRGCPLCPMCEDVLRTRA